MDGYYDTGLGDLGCEINVAGGGRYNFTAGDTGNQPALIQKKISVGAKTTMTGIIGTSVLSINQQPPNVGYKAGGV